MQYLWFSVIYGCPNKIVQLFWKYLAVPHFPILYKVEPYKKNSGYVLPTLFMGCEKGMGVCPKTFVHGFRLKYFNLKSNTTCDIYVYLFCGNYYKKALHLKINVFDTKVLIIGDTIFTFLSGDGNVSFCGQVSYMRV